MSSLSVSVLTPSFNQGRFIGHCLASIANQTYADIEHIVMDAGSTDSTLAVLENAGGNVTWQSEPDRGQSHALNKALSRSHGEIIGWINSDDAYADRRAVEQAVRVFETYPDVGVVYGHSLLADAENRVLQLLWAPANAQRLLGSLTTYTQPAVFLRRSLLEERFLREDLHFVMDRDLWVTLSDKTRFQRLNLIVGVDRHHAARKVESAAFEIERKAYFGPRFETIRHRTLVKTIKLYCRLMGLGQIATLKASLSPAFPLEFDSTFVLAARQGLVPRRFMA